MIRNRRLLARLIPMAGLIVLGVWLALPATVEAQELYTYTVGVLGGVGGSYDVDPGSSYGNHGFQINLGLVTEPKTVLGLRVGRLSLNDKPTFGSLTNADLTFADIAGEYRFDETYYQSGVYLGLGAYRLRGKRDGLFEREQTAVGGVLGLTGEFPLNSHFGIILDLAGHYTPLDEAKIFVTGNAGVAFHF
ncbi:MAG TPA: hypothetical protein VMM92_16030 [Thermoanaerobaculia bacterium]|nr:hypothetical protein [Thermoanaerobaculia bacterium]